MLVKDKIAESGHWYERDGTPKYTVVAKNGQNRSTTLRDARSLSLVPSVTTIINVAAKPGLDTWKQQQVLLSALTLPKRQDELEADWLERVMQDSKATGKAAAERGTAIHAMIEAYFEGNIIPDAMPMCNAVQEALDYNFGKQQWFSEKSFAHELGFGGKCDLYADNIVVDIKTKEGDLQNVDIYAEHGMQLAAYREGFGMPTARCANVFVSSTHPGVVKLIEHDSDELAKNWKMFVKLLEFWQLKNNHK